MALSMFVSTSLIGYLPTKFNTSQRWLNLISIYGAGLLVGAAIIVILPEGMLVLFESLLNKEVLAIFEGTQTLDSHGHSAAENINTTNNQVLDNTTSPRVLSL